MRGGLIAALLALSACAEIIGIDTWSPEGAAPGSATASATGGGATGGGGGGGAPAGSGGGAGGGTPGGTVLWAKAFGDWAEQRPGGIAVVPGTGDVAIGGFFLGQIDFGGGPLQSSSPDLEDAFLARLDAEGNQVWANRYGGGPTDREHVFGLAGHPGGGVTGVGAFNGTLSIGPQTLMATSVDGFAATVDAAGAHVFGRQVGGTGDEYAVRVAVHPDGDVVVAGDFSGSLALGPGSPPSTGMDSYVARYAASGGLLWVEIFGGAGDQDIDAVAFAADGTIFVGGAFGGELSVSGVHEGTAAGVRDGFVTWLSPTGDPIWTRILGGPGSERVTALAVDPAGPLVAGDFDDAVSFGSGGGEATLGDTDAFVAALDLIGEYRWSTPLGGAGAQTAQGIAAGDGGAVLVCGDFDGAIVTRGLDLQSADLRDVFVASLAPDGSPRWASRFGGANDQICKGVAAGPAGVLWIAGDLLGSMELDGFALMAATDPGDRGPGAADVFVARLTQ